jgi:hypothetical protein
VARRSAAVSEEDRRNAERRKILKRLASYEGDGLSDQEAQWLERQERDNGYMHQLELERGKRTAGF